MKRLRSMYALVAVAVVAVLVGCTPAVTELTAAPVATEILAETPAPEPTSPPSLADLVVSPDGLGALLLGSPVPATPQPADMIVFDPTFCADSRTQLDQGVADDDPLAARWVANYDPISGKRGPAYAPFSVAVDEGIVTRIDIWTDLIRTSGGIAMGSTLEELLAAHPGIEASRSVEAQTTLYLLEGDAGRVLIEVAEEAPGVVGNWEATESNTILLLRVQTLAGAIGSAYASGNIAGTCL